MVLYLPMVARRYKYLVLLLLNQGLLQMAVILTQILLLCHRIRS